MENRCIQIYIKWVILGHNQSLVSLLARPRTIEPTTITVKAPRCFFILHLITAHTRPNLTFQTCWMFGSTQVNSLGEAGGENARRRGPFENKFWVNITLQRPKGFRFRLMMARNNSSCFYRHYGDVQRQTLQSTSRQGGTIRKQW